MVSGAGRGAAEAGGAGEEKEEAGTIKCLCGETWGIIDCGNASCLRYRDQKPTVKKRKMKHGGT